MYFRAAECLPIRLPFTWCIIEHYIVSLLTQSIRTCYLLLRTVPLSRFSINGGTRMKAAERAESTAEDRRTNSIRSKDEGTYSTRTMRLVTLIGRKDSSERFDAHSSNACSAICGYESALQLAVSCEAAFLPSFFAPIPRTAHRSSEGSSRRFCR